MKPEYLVLIALVVVAAALITGFYATLLYTLGREPRVLDWPPLARGFAVAVAFISVLAGAVILLEGSGFARRRYRLAYALFGFVFGFGAAFLPHMDALLFGELGSPEQPKPLWVKLAAGAAFSAIFAFQAGREKRLSGGSSAGPTPSLPPRPSPD
jgi:hypothetical protein